MELRLYIKNNCEKKLSGSAPKDDGSIGPASELKKRTYLSESESDSEEEESDSKERPIYNEMGMALKGGARRNKKGTTMRRIKSKKRKMTKKRR